MNDMNCDKDSVCRNLDGNFSCGVSPVIEPQNTGKHAWLQLHIIQVSIIVIIERPNHNLSYTVGTNFCLEDMDSVLPSMSMECLVGNEPDPLPEFFFTVERMLVSNSTKMLQRQMSNESILLLHETVVLSLFNEDTVSISVTCTAYNGFGNDSDTTIITICGIYDVIQGRRQEFRKGGSILLTRT